MPTRTLEIVQNLGSDRSGRIRQVTVKASLIHIRFYRQVVCSPNYIKAKYSSQVHMPRADTNACGLNLIHVHVFEYLSKFYTYSVFEVRS
jgi:hypothetical protein